MLSGHPLPSEESKANIALAFVGCIVPDQLSSSGPAFNRAGNMFQENLLLALKESGLPVSIILSQRQLQAFPKSRIIWSAGKQTSLASGLSVKLVSFLNLPILRPLTVGLAVLINLMGWGWQQRGTPHKVVYTFNLTEPSGLFTLISARLIGAKAVASVNDVHVPGEIVSATLSRRLDFWLQKKLIPRFDGLVVVNKRIIEDFAPNVPFIRIEGGIKDITLQRSSIYSGTPTKRDDPFTIVSVGTLYQVNGFIELLEAFSLLPGNGYRLRIAGTGPLEEAIRQAAEKDPRIEYCGYLSFKEVLELYDTADVLINMRPTKAINTNYFFPSKMVEYLASGVPVITTCTGHIEEEYADIAFLLKDESPQGLARMIEHVASMDPETRVQKGQAAQSYIRTHNSWEAQGRRVVKFVNDQILHSQSN